MKARPLGSSEFAAPKQANSDAAALAGYLTALGLNVQTDTVNRLLVLLAVLVVECGGGLALVVGMSPSGADGHVWDTEVSGRTPGERTPADAADGHQVLSPELPGRPRVLRGRTRCLDRRRPRARNQRPVSASSASSATAVVSWLADSGRWRKLSVGQRAAFTTCCINWQAKV